MKDRKIEREKERIESISVEILERVHNGVVFEKKRKKDGYIVYMVYLEGVNMINRMRTYEEYEKNTKHKFKIYIYEGEYRERKKVRIMRVGSEN